MIRKFLKTLALLTGILLLALLFFIWWASGPGIPPENFPGTGLQVLGTSPTPPKHAPPLLKVVSYNMGYASGKLNNQGHVLQKAQVENNLAQMADVLKVLSPDILLLQEVDFHSRRSFEISQMDYLARALKLPYAAHAVTWNKRYVAWPYWPANRHFGKMVSGQAILSRYPLSHLEILRFPKPKDNAFWYNWFYLDRLVQRVQVQVGQDIVEVYNAHLEAFSAPTRSAQVQGLAQWIEQSKIPLKIAGGDFNMIWESSEAAPELVQKEKNLLKAFSQSTRLQMGNPKTVQYTFPSWKPDKRIDYIFYSSQFQALTGGVMEQLKASDHLPVWTVLKWPQK